MDRTASPPRTASRAIWPPAFPAPCAAWNTPPKNTDSKPWAELVAPAVELAAKGFPVSWGLARIARIRAARRLAQLSGIEAHLPARRQTLRAGRNPDAAGTGAHARAHRPGRGRRFLRRRNGAPAGRGHGSARRTHHARRSEELHGGGTTSRSPAAIADTPSSPRRPQFRRHRASCRCWACWKARDTKNPARARQRPLHYLAEAMRRYFADRSEYLGDPEFVKVPVSKLLDRRYIAELRRSIDPDARHAQRAGAARQARSDTKAPRPRTTTSSMRKATQSP